MITCHLIENGRNLHQTVFLPTVPQQCDIVALSSDPKTTHYLVKNVEFFNNHNSVNLHVKVFPNQNSVYLAIDNIG